MSNIQLYRGDCLEIMKNIPDKSVDAIICDLPYGTTACKWDEVIPFEPMWEQYHRIITDKGAIVLTSSNPFTTKLAASNLKHLKYSLVWEKSKGSNFVHANFQPMKTHEDILVFSMGGSAQGSKNPMTYNPQKTPGKPYDKGNATRVPEFLSGGNIQDGKNETGDRMPRSVIYFRTAESEGKFHPTQKPVALMEYLIKTYTNEGDVVLDNCMGSGTTGIACLNTNRKFIGIEQEEKYFEVSKKRIEEHQATNTEDVVSGFE